MKEIVTEEQIEAVQGKDLL